MKVKLTESRLNQIVAESVKRVLSEIGDTKQGSYLIGRTNARAAFRGDEETYTICI